jgi:hypothetical protein
MANLWKQISPTNRRHIITGTRTFVATFLALSVPALIATGVENWTVTTLTSVGVAALNGALKVLWETYSK